MVRQVEDTLVTRDVSKRYGELAALIGVDLAISPGEIVALIGPNGAGKTTFASIVAGIVRADTGTIIINGCDAAREGPKSRHMLGYVPQETGVYPTTTVRQNLRFSALVHGVHKSDVNRRVGETAEALRLEHILDRMAGRLSGGEKRRLHTGMALLHSPNLLLLDEPTTGVDVDTRNHLLQYIQSLAEKGTAICYTTHYLPEVEMLGARVSILSDGRIVISGEIEELVKQYGNSSIIAKFDGKPPNMRGVSTIVDGATAIYQTASPAELAAVLLQQTDVQVETIEIVRPSLESVYLGLVGYLERPIVESSN